MAKNKEAFTTIELIITIAIIALFSGFALASYNRATQDQRLDRTVKQIADVLELAKGKAKSSDLSVPCEDNRSFAGFIVTLNQNDYNLNIQCALADGTPVPNTTPIQRYDMDTNLSITSGMGQILFKPISGITNSATELQIVVKNSVINQCVTIKVSPVGLISQDSKIDC